MTSKARRKNIRKAIYGQRLTPYSNTYAQDMNDVDEPIYYVYDGSNFKETLEFDIWSATPEELDRMRENFSLGVRVDLRKISKSQRAKRRDAATQYGDFVTVAVCESIDSDSIHLVVVDELDAIRWEAEGFPFHQGAAYDIERLISNRSDFFGHIVLFVCNDLERQRVSRFSNEHREINGYGLYLVETRT